MIGWSCVSLKITTIGAAWALRRCDGSVAIWLSHRVATARSNPGAFDTLVAGGLPLGRDPAETLVAEAAEEAGIGPDLLQAATPAGSWAITCAGGPFLHREVLIAHDLWLPPDVVPVCSDGEIKASRLFAWDALRSAVARRHGIKPNSLAVCRDLLARRDASGKRHSQAGGGAAGAIGLGRRPQG